MSSVIELVAIAWASWWTFLAVRRLAEGNRHSILFMMLVFYSFYVVPLLWDNALGKPAFRPFPGYRVACYDEWTSIGYCAYVALVPPFWYLTGLTRGLAKGHTRTVISARGRAAIARLRPLFVLFLIAPAVLVALAPNPGEYLEYARHVRHGVVFSSLDYHNLVSLSTLLCVLGGSGLIVAASRRSPMMLAPILPFLVLACWVNGKRHIVAYVLVLLLFALWQKRVFSGLGLVLAGLGTVAGILAFSLFYQSYVRGINLVGSESAYENMRVDFGRDGALKLAIFAELEPSRARILEYRCQSIVFYLTFYLPRSAYPDKPWPYAVYLTSSALGLKAPRYLGWVVTTGWFDESIANFGWLGLLIGPSLFTLIARVGDGCQSELTRTLTIVVGSVLQVVHPWASSPIIALWIVAVIMSRRSQRQRMSLEYPSGRVMQWTPSPPSSRRSVDQNL